MNDRTPRTRDQVREALKTLDIFRPTEAAILRKEIVRQRRVITNLRQPVPILPGDINDLASKIQQLRRHYPTTNIPPHRYVDAIISAGWTPGKGTG